MKGDDIVIHARAHGMMDGAWQAWNGPASYAAMASEPTPTALQATEDPTLAGFRKSIDNIDAALIHMLAERFRITKAVGIDVDTPWRGLAKEDRDWLLYTDEQPKVLIRRRGEPDDSTGREPTTLPPGSLSRA